MAEAQMEVQYCEPLCWQLPVWNKLVLTFHLSFAPQLLFFVCEALHLSQISAWLLKHVAVSWCSARRAFFFFFLDLGSSRAFAQFHIMSVCLSWPDITSQGWARGVIFCHLIPLNTAALKSVKLWQRCHVCGVIANLQIFSPVINIVCIRSDGG